MRYILLLFSLLLTGCMFGPDTPKDQYSLEECKEEMLDAEDYAEDGG